MWLHIAEPRRCRAGARTAGRAGARGGLRGVARTHASGAACAHGPAHPARPERGGRLAMRTLPRGPIAGRIVTLRDPTADDVDGIVDACNDPQTQRFLGQLPQPYTRDDALDWITNQIPSGWAAGQAGFAVTLTGDDRIAGSVGLG